MQISVYIFTLYPTARIRVRERGKYEIRNACNGEAKKKKTRRNWQINHMMITRAIKSDEVLFSFSSIRVTCT